jgi:hypothetical protein
LETLQFRQVGAIHGPSTQRHWQHDQRDIREQSRQLPMAAGRSRTDGNWWLNEVEPL